MVKPVAIKGDITLVETDAIVNAANPSLLGGGGVDGAIHRAAGPELLEACRNIKVINGVRCPAGEARITPGFRLPAKFVIHTVGPVYYSDDNPPLKLQMAYRNSLLLALENDCQSIAFPAISCGVYGYPADEAAEISVSVCSEPQFENLDIQFYLFNEVLLHIWLSAIGQAS